jgi:hypothetical protein
MTSTIGAGTLGRVGIEVQTAGSASGPPGASAFVNVHSEVEAQMRTTPAARVQPHLVPCVACGSANGLNAPRCWNCDAALPPVAFEAVDLSSAFRGAASPAAPAPVEAPAPRHDPHPRVDALPRLEEAFAPLRSAALEAARWRRRTLVGVGVGVAAALSLAGYALFRPPVDIRLADTELSPVPLAGTASTVPDSTVPDNSAAAPTSGAPALPAAALVPQPMAPARLPVASKRAGAKAADHGTAAAQRNRKVRAVGASAPERKTAARRKIVAPAKR